MNAIIHPRDVTGKWTRGRGLHHTQRGLRSVTILTENSNPIASVTMHPRLFVLRCACTCGWTHNVARFLPNRREVARSAIREHMWGGAHA